MLTHCSIHYLVFCEKGDVRKAVAPQITAPFPWAPQERPGIQEEAAEPQRFTKLGRRH